MGARRPVALGLTPVTPLVTPIPNVIPVCARHVRSASADIGISGGTYGIPDYPTDGGFRQTVLCDAATSLSALTAAKCWRLRVLTRPHDCKTRMTYSSLAKTSPKCRCCCFIPCLALMKDAHPKGRTLDTQNARGARGPPANLTSNWLPYARAHTIPQRATGRGCG